MNLLGWTFTFAIPDWQTDVSPTLPPPQARHSTKEPAAADAAITGTIVHNRWTFRVASLFDFQLAEPPGRFIWIVACDSEPVSCVSDFRPIHFDDPPPLPPP